MDKRKPAVGEVWETTSGSPLWCEVTVTDLSSEGSVTFVRGLGTDGRPATWELYELVRYLGTYRDRVILESANVDCREVSP